VDPGDGGIVLDEDCLGELTPPPYVFARAYIDVNQNQSYEGETDIDIAYVEDLNNNGVLDIGDQVVFSQYPLSFDPCPAGDCSAGVGNYSGAPVAVATVDDGRPLRVAINLTANSTLTFAIVLGGEYLLNGNAVSPQCQIRDDDSSGIGIVDRIFQVESQNCLGTPATEVELEGPPASDYFLEIEFYPDLS
jgi:hypothetical protein